MYESGSITTQTLIEIGAKLELINQIARQKRVISKDPRYDAIILKTEKLAERMQKLIPAVMLQEIAHFTAATDELYKVLGEKEEPGNLIIQGGKGNDH